jgi:hypothetical protein
VPNLLLTVAGDVMQSRLAAGVLGALGPGSESLARNKVLDLLALLAQKCKY